MSIFQSFRHHTGVQSTCRPCNISRPISDSRGCVVSDVAGARGMSLNRQATLATRHQNALFKNRTDRNSRCNCRYGAWKATSFCCSNRSRSCIGPRPRRTARNRRFSGPWWSKSRWIRWSIPISTSKFVSCSNFGSECINSNNQEYGGKVRFHGTSFFVKKIAERQETARFLRSHNFLVTLNQI